MTPINIKSYGAVEGSDCHAALVAACAAGANQQQVEIIIPAGTWSYSNDFTVEGAILRGEPGAVLHATTPGQAAVKLIGSRPAVRQIRFTGVADTRLSNWESVRIYAQNAIDFSIDGNTIENSASVGIRNDGSTGVIANNIVSGTLADSIHLTGGAHHVRIEGNVVGNSGDDGIGVVSYEGGGLCHHIIARKNIINNNTGGRGMSVVGGSDILYEYNSIHNNTHGSGIYIAQEHGTWDTQPVNRITVRRNEVVECGYAAIGHFAVFLVGGNVNPNQGILFERNIVSSSYYGGIKVSGTQSSSVWIDRNLIVATTALYFPDGSTGITTVTYDGGPVGLPD